MLGRAAVYWDRRDQWVGRHRDPDKGLDYYCLIPCLVIRVPRCAGRNVP